MKKKLPKEKKEKGVKEKELINKRIHFEAI
jgi:hypothetical protein